MRVLSLTTHLVCVCVCVCVCCKQVIASDDLPRPVSSLCLVPDPPDTTDTLHGARSRRDQPRGYARLPDSPMRAPGAPVPPAALLQVMPDGRGNYWWAPQPQEPAAPELPGARARSDDAGTKERRALMVDAPVTVVAADTAGSVALLRAQPLTLSPVRNLTQIATYHVSDRVCRAEVCGGPGAEMAVAVVGGLRAAQADVVLAGASGAVYRLRPAPGVRQAGGAGDLSAVLWALERCLCVHASCAPLSGVQHDVYRARIGWTYLPINRQAPTRYARMFARSHATHTTLPCAFALCTYCARSRMQYLQASCRPHSAHTAPHASCAPCTHRMHVFPACVAACVANFLSRTCHCMRTLSCVHCRAYTVMCTLSCVQCRVYTVMCTLSCVHCRGILDGDLLSRYLDLPWPVKRSVAQSVLATKGVSDTLSPLVKTLLPRSTADKGEREECADAAMASEGGGDDGDRAEQQEMGDEGLDATVLLLVQLTQQALYDA